MKIFTGCLSQECNTMASTMTDFNRVTQTVTITRGQDAIDRSRGVGFLGGIVDFCEANGVEMVCTSRVDVAFPPFTKKCMQQLMDPIIEGLSACKDEIDGICFVLHGAGGAEGIDDLEAYVLQKFRDVVGPDMPITVPLDLHGNISPEMATLADGLFGIKEYPHTDMYDAGRLAMESLYNILTTGKKPHNAYVQLPMFVIPAAGCTLEEPFISIKQYFADYAKAHNLLDATFFHGYPYADTKYASSSIVTVGFEGVEEAAQELADYIWNRRKDFRPIINSAEKALEIAKAYQGEGYVLMNEASDNPGGGAPGDGTHLLREMLRQDLPGSVFCFIFDPEAAKKIAAAGPGNKVDLSLGGKIEKLHGKPIELKDAYVVSVCDGQFISNSPLYKGMRWNVKLSGRIRVGNVDILVSSAQVQSYDDGLIRALGIDPAECRYIAIKSTHHFRAYFKDHAGLIVPVETPGIHCADLSVFDYKKILRPLFPLDEV